MRKLLVVVVLLLLLLLGVAYATEVTTGTVIVAKPGVYKAGESATGVLWVASGEELEIRQKVEAGKAGQLYLIKEFVSDDVVKLRSAMNLTGPEGYASTGKDSSRLVESNCTRDSFYPIVLGKVYECEVSSVSTGNVTVRTRLRSEIISADMDKDGRIVSYCVLEHADHGVGASTTEVCYSGDGKWIITARVTNVVQRMET